MNRTGILIVEDEGITALNMKVTLTGGGFDVTGIAPSGENALKIIEQSESRVVLMDIKLRGKMDGVETAAEIKKQDIILIYTTAHDDEETLARIKETRPYAVLLKPVSEDLLKQTITEAVACKSQSAGPNTLPEGL